MQPSRIPSLGIIPSSHKKCLRTGGACFVWRRWHTPCPKALMILLSSRTPWEPTAFFRGGLPALVIESIFYAEAVVGIFALARQWSSRSRHSVFITCLQNSNDSGSSLAKADLQSLMNS